MFPTDDELRVYFATHQVMLSGLGVLALLALVGTTASALAPKTDEEMRALERRAPGRAALIRLAKKIGVDLLVGKAVKMLLTIIVTKLVAGALDGAPSASHDDPSGPPPEDKS